jgi:hypothetical protein
MESTYEHRIEYKSKLAVARTAYITDEADSIRFMAQSWIWQGVLRTKSLWPVELILPVVAAQDGKLPF